MTDTEREKYNQLEDDFIRLKWHRRYVPWWGRVRRRPTPELVRAFGEAKRSLQTLSQHLEHCKKKTEEPRKVVQLLERVEGELTETIKKFPCLGKS